MTEEEFQKLANKIKARTATAADIDAFCKELATAVSDIKGIAEEVLSAGSEI